MENYFTFGSLVIIAILVYRWNPKPKKDGRTSEEIKAEFEKKEVELKAIYANMREFDKLIIKRDAALKAGDKELFYAKNKEAYNIYQEGNKLFK